MRVMRHVVIGSLMSLAMFVAVIATGYRLGIGNVETVVLAGVTPWLVWNLLGLFFRRRKQTELVPPRPIGPSDS